MSEAPIRLGHTITIANLTANDAVDHAVQLLSVLPKGSRTVLIELPCVGAPGIAHRTLINEFMAMPKEQTSEQFFLDYDRNEPKPLGTYMYRHQQVDYMVIHPRTLVDNTVIGRLQSNRALIEGPGFLKEHLQKNYDFIIFLTQGIINQPSTFFSIRYADSVILYSDKRSDYISNAINYDRLIQHYGVPKERLFLFSADRHVTSKEIKVFVSYAELLKTVVKQPAQSIEPQFLSPSLPVHSEVVGRINPVEYLSSTYTPSIVIGDTGEDQDKLDKFTDHIRVQLKNNYLDDFAQISQNIEARERVRFYIADMVRENTEYEIAMNTEKLIEYMQQSITMFGPLQPLLDDPTISSIEVNDRNETIVEQNGVDVYRDDIVFRDYNEMYQIINRMLAPFGKTLSSNDPIIDAYFEGMRICAIADNNIRAGVSNNSPLLSIRKFPKHIFDRETCVANGNISQEVDEFLADIVPHGANIVVAGGTNSGKTSKLQMLPMYVAPVTRIVTIEDSKELMLKQKKQYQDYPNLPALSVKEMENQEKTIDIGKLVKTSLRMRPTIIVVGEIRDKAAAKEAVQAANTGHFLWTSVHSNSAGATPKRLLDLHGVDDSSASSIGDAIHLIIHQVRLPDGQRVVKEIAELVSFDTVRDLKMNTIFSYDMDTKTHVFYNKIKSAKFIEELKTRKMPEEALARWCDMEQFQSPHRKGSA